MAGRERERTATFSTLERVEAKEGLLGPLFCGGFHAFQYPRTGRSQGRSYPRALKLLYKQLSVPSNGSKPRKDVEWRRHLAELFRLSVPSNGSKPRKASCAKMRCIRRRFFQYPRTGRSQGRGATLDVVWGDDGSFSTLERVEAKEGLEKELDTCYAQPFSTLERVEAKEGCEQESPTAHPSCFEYPRTGRGQGRIAVRARWCAAPALSVPSNGSKPRKESALRCC